MVFQSRPGVHGDGAQLDLGIIGAVHEDDHVEAPVAIGLDVADIVLFFHELYAGEGQQAVMDRVNVIEESADDAEADGVADLHERGLRGLRKPLAAALFPHAVFGFDPAQKMLDGIHSEILRHIPADHAYFAQQHLHHFFEFRFFVSVNTFHKYDLHCDSLFRVFAYTVLSYHFWRCIANEWHKR